MPSITRMLRLVVRNKLFLNTKQFPSSDLIEISPFGDSCLRRFGHNYVHDDHLQFTTNQCRMLPGNLLCTLVLRLRRRRRTLQSCDNFSLMSPLFPKLIDEFSSVSNPWSKHRFFHFIKICIIVHFLLSKQMICQRFLIRRDPTLMACNFQVVIYGKFLIKRDFSEAEAATSMSFVISHSKPIVSDRLDHVTCWGEVNLKSYQENTFFL